MKNKKVLFIAILSIITLSQNCSKDELILNEDYITVSDLTRYCRCKCRKETFPCEDKEVKIKGHIDYYSFNTNFSYQSYSIEGFRLIDIRNSNNIYICFNINDLNDKKLVINKILSSNETDMCYIKGIVKSVQINSGFTCTLEAEIILNSADDFFYKNETNY